MKQELGNKGIVEDATSRKNTRQLWDLCLQHEIPTSRRVENVLERNRAELEMELRARGVSIKGKQTGVGGLMHG